MDRGLEYLIDYYTIRGKQGKEDTAIRTNPHSH